MKNSQHAAYSIRCLRAIEALVGGREILAVNLKATRGCIDQWIRKEKIAPNKIITLVRLSNGKFTAEELLGGSDEGAN